VNRRQFLLIGTFLVLGVLLGFVWRNAKQPAKRAAAAPPAAESSATASAANAALLKNDPTPAGVLERFFARIQGADLKPGDLDAFRRAILEAPRGEAIRALVAFLATGRDATTGEAFSVGDHGELAGAPTFRVLLLDLLGRLCRDAKSSEALTVSRGLLDHKTSADEWAIALRNVGWAAPQDTAFLTAKARELLHYQPWRQQPTAGYREAFDVIVFARAVPLIPDLTEVLVGDDQSLQTSAAVALDRLAELAPLDAMTFLNQNRAELAQKPFLRADYFSKADFSQASQRAAVETYLSRPDVQVTEKAKMLAVLASPGSFASDSLLTQPPPDEFPPQRVEALRRTVGEWLVNSRFPELAGPLRQLQLQIAD
jgi:hypothetical protein